MRLFERLRLRLGFLPIQLQKDSKERRELADIAAAAPYADATESMCCGHCSGNAEGHVAELPTAH